MKQILSQMFALFSHIMFFVVCEHLGEKVCASLAPTGNSDIQFGHKIVSKSHAKFRFCDIICDDFVSKFIM